MRGYERAGNTGSSSGTELRIPMRGYELFSNAVAPGGVLVTNPHAGL